MNEAKYLITIIISEKICLILNAYIIWKILGNNKMEKIKSDIILLTLSMLIKINSNIIILYNWEMDIKKSKLSSLSK